MAPIGDRPECAVQDEVVVLEREQRDAVRCRRGPRRREIGEPQPRLAVSLDREGLGFDAIEPGPDVALRATCPLRDLRDRDRTGVREKRVEHAAERIERRRCLLAIDLAPEVALGIQPSAIERALDATVQLEPAQRQRQWRADADFLAGLAKARNLAAELFADRIWSERRRGERPQHRRRQRLDVGKRLADLCEISGRGALPVVAVPHHQIRDERAGHEVDATARRRYDPQITGSHQVIELRAPHPGAS